MSIKKPREQDLYGPVIQFLALHGIPAFRLNSGAVQTIHRTWVRLAPKGSSDIVGIISRPGTQWHGRWVCCEMKLRPADKPTPAQSAWLQGMRDAGAVVILARDIKEIEAQLRQIGVIA